MKDESNTILRLKQVKEITGLGRSSIYKFIKGGKFPRQRKLGARAVGWHSGDVFIWVTEREIVL